MSTINDEIKRATSGATVTEGLSTWYSRTASENLKDAERRWLLTQVGVTSGANNDLWYQFLRAAGFLGAMGDMKLAYWKAQP